MQLNDILFYLLEYRLFLNQVKLIEHHERIENHFNLKSNQIINKLMQFQKQNSATLEEKVIKILNEIKQCLDYLHCNHYFKREQSFNIIVNIGILV